MALIMFVGVATTLFIDEPKTAKKYTEYTILDYSRFFMLFLFVVLSFILIYVTTNPLVKLQKCRLRKYLEINNFLDLLLAVLE